MLHVRAQCPGLEYVDLRRSPRAPPLLRALPAEPPGAAGAGTEVRPGQPGPLRARGGAGPGRGHRGHRLHLGHHRAAQGRDALAPQPDRDRAERGRAGAAHRGRGGHGLPADGVDRRPHVLLQPVDGGRLHHQLSGERGHRAGRPQGDRADLLLRPAPHLGEHPHLGDDPGGGQRLAQAAPRPLLPRPRPPGGALPPRPPPDRPAGPPARAPRAPPGVGAAAGQPGHEPDPDRLHRGRGHRARAVRVLPLTRHQREAALRHDRVERADLHPARRRREARHGGAAPAGGRGAGQPERGGAYRSPGVFQGYYKNPQATARDAGGRVGPLRRRGVLRQGRPPEDHRPRPGRGAAGERDDLRPQVPREQAQVLPLHQGGGVRGRRPALRGRAAQHRPGLGGQLGGAARARLHELHRPRPEARGLRADPPGGACGSTGACGRTTPCGARRSGGSCCSTRSSTRTTRRSPGPGRCAAASSPRSTPRSSRRLLRRGRLGAGGGAGHLRGRPHRHHAGRGPPERRPRRSRTPRGGHPHDRRAHPAARGRRGQRALRRRCRPWSG